MLETKGYQMGDVPYVVEMNNTLKKFSDGHSYTVQEKTTTIPELRITQIKSFNCNYMGGDCE